MQQLLINNLRLGFNANAALNLKLAESVAEADMTAQPAADMNHPAWILKHLSLYHPVIEALLTGGEPNDPKGEPFGLGTTPVADPAVYGPWDTVISDYRAGTQRVLAALDTAAAGDPNVLTRTMPIPRWQKRFPQAGTALGYLMLHHEAFHAGQLSAWRRARGLPRL